jgi:hypothetical protein
MKPFQVTATLLPIVVMHGAPGIGKTTTAAKFPNPVFIQTEDGCPSGLTISSFGLCDSFASVIEALTWLGKETHDYQTLVIDSLDALEPLVQAALCADRGYASVESPGFGKGYVELDKYWLDFLRGCNWLRRQRNMIIVMIAHSEIIMINDPRTTAYSPYALRLHKRARGLVEDNADFDRLPGNRHRYQKRTGGLWKNPRPGRWRQYALAALRSAASIHTEKQVRHARTNSGPPELRLPDDAWQVLPDSATAGGECAHDCGTENCN